MCCYKSKKQGGVVEISQQTLSHINGRPVLQPYSNRDPLFKISTSAKSKISITNPPIKRVNDSNILNTSNDQKTVTPKNSPNFKISAAKVKSSVTTPPVSPKIKSPRQPAIKKVKNDPNGSSEKIVTPIKGNDDETTILVKNSCKKDSSFLILEVAAGSIAAARREQVANMQVQRKQRIAHYGRTNSAKYEAKLVTAAAAADSSSRETKRCSFITTNSDPVYLAYHDEEWGVPVHDDNLLFELLVLTVAQVGSDWTSVLKKRQDFRDAFSGFDAEFVAKYNEKKINSTSSEYGIELSQVRGVIDNSKRILEIKRQFGSFHKYLWGFVSNKPIATKYKACNKIPVKTSKSETMSKDMVKRGFRYVGPTVIHSFMQAVGLTNDHIITCPRHLQCAALLATQQHIIDM